MVNFCSKFKIKIILVSQVLTTSWTGALTTGLMLKERSVTSLFMMDRSHDCAVMSPASLLTVSEDVLAQSGRWW